MPGWISSPLGWYTGGWVAAGLIAFYLVAAAGRLNRAFQVEAARHFERLAPDDGRQLARLSRVYALHLALLLALGVGLHILVVLPFAVAEWLVVTSLFEPRPVYVVAVPVARW